MEITGVRVFELKQVPDERGKVMPMLRRDAGHFEKFGEIYFSCVHPGAIKGWHQHSLMTLNYACISGHIKLVLFDPRAKSNTFGKIQEIFIGESNYCLVQIPPEIWNGFKGIGDKTSIVANCSTEPHSPAEIQRMSPFTKEIPYDWELKHG